MTHRGILTKKTVITSIAATALMLIIGCQNAGNKNVDALNINPTEMKQVGTVSERFQSYNVEMVEVVGGEFWKPYKMMDSLPSAEATGTYDVSQKNPELYRKLEPVDLTNKRILNLAKGLAPAYVRVSGTWTNATYFQDNDEPIQPAPEGFLNVLTRSQWKGVLDFLKATNSELVTSFAVSSGVRNQDGVWTPVEAQKLVNYTKSLGGSVAAAELFNEPTMPLSGGLMNPNYDASYFAKDVAAFNAWAKKEVPNMKTLGPGAVLEGMDGVTFDQPGMKLLAAEDLMTAEPKPTFDVFSYHFYGAASIRMMNEGPFSIKAENALGKEWLQRTDQSAAFYMGLRDKYMPGTEIWLTETAQAAAGGDPYAATFLDCFRYLYQHGSLAKKGVKVIMHNTFLASEYSLIDQDTYLPKPNYWAALLWAKLMGTEVYDAGTEKEGIYVFAHNLKGSESGKTILIINTSKEATSINLPSDAEQFTLTSNELEGTNVLLNGQELALTANDEVPTITGKNVKAGNIELPETSISFFTLSNK